MSAKTMTALVAVIIAPIIGAILMGLDRKITARVQGRIGPPVLQPFYDFFKLFQKEALVLNRAKTLYVYFHLSFMILTIVLLSTGGDMLMALFTHAFSGIALILGGMSVRSPYSRIGAQRKLMQMLAYEPVLILMVVGIAKQNWSFMASDVVTMTTPLLVTLPLVLLAYLMALLIKMDKSPFDVATSHHAHQELVKGVTLEFSGPYLAIIELTHFYEVFLLFAVIAFFWASNLALGIALALVCFVGQIFVDNAFARLRTMWMVRFMWTIPMALALFNISWIYI